MVSLVNTQKHQNITGEIAQPLPPVPASEADAIRDMVNRRPTFFGCNPSPVPEWPLVVYIPNAPPVTGEAPVTNPDSFQLRFSDKHTSLFLDQAYQTATSGFIPGQLGADPEWAKCLQCAMVDRQRYRTVPAFPPRSAICNQCFTRYCFDPASPPSPENLAVVGRQTKFTDPDPQPSFFERHKKVILIVAGVAGGLLLLGLVTTIAVCCCLKHKASKFLKRSRGRDRGLYQSVNEETAALNSGRVSHDLPR